MYDYSAMIMYIFSIHLVHWNRRSVLCFFPSVYLRIVFRLYLALEETVFPAALVQTEQNKHLFCYSNWPNKGRAEKKISQRTQT